MNILLLASIILTTAPAQGQGGRFSGDSLTSNLASSTKLEPCHDWSNADAYDEFARKHIVTDIFKRKLKDEWAKYLEKNNLCGRTPIQSFIEAKDEIKVKQICISGRRLNDKSLPGNLCISTNKIQMYNVKSTNSCSVTQVTEVKQYVVVACNKIEMKNVCLPVHFEKYNEQQPDNKPPCLESPNV